MDDMNFTFMNMEFVNSPFITELKFTQSQEATEKFLYLTISEGGKKTKLTLKNPSPYEDSFDIVDATKIWIEDEGNSQKEYGRFKIGYYSDESYNEFWVDSVELS